jgi:hypothetical protein
MEKIEPAPSATWSALRRPRGPSTPPTAGGPPPRRTLVHLLRNRRANREVHDPF